MEYTEKQKAALRARFRQRQLYQGSLVVPVFLTILMVMFSPHHFASLGVMPILISAVALLALIAAFSWFNWRCPACRKYLGMGLAPANCPGCGLVLRIRAGR